MSKLKIWNLCGRTTFHAFPRGTIDANFYVLPSRNANTMKSVQRYVNHAIATLKILKFSLPLYEACFIFSRSLFLPKWNSCRYSWTFFFEIKEMSIFYSILCPWHLFNFSACQSLKLVVLCIRRYKLKRLENK